MPGAFSDALFKTSETSFQREKSKPAPFAKFAKSAAPAERWVVKCALQRPIY